MLSYHQFNEPPEYEGISESLFQLYRQRTAQCLLIGDIAKCLPYTLETLRFNATAELNRRDDSSRGLWIMTGVIVRTAINMGYHRDPSQSPSLSILQAEYRRRVWQSVMSMDDVASFIVGFPRMMSSIYSDTLEPRNLHDWELSDDTTVLPPSRPLTESTQATYLIVKGRLFRALGRVTDFNSALSVVSYDTVLEIDKSLYEAYQNFPPFMKVRGNKRDLNLPYDKYYVSSLQLESMYHKGMCILHRRFIAKGTFDSRYNRSRERCISSALGLLYYQHTLEPFWYKFSQTRQMLTLAAMILFLELEHRRRGLGIGAFSESDVLLQALEESCALWKAATAFCDEASRVYQILADMLSSFQPVAETSSSQTQTSEPAFDFFGIGSGGGFSWEKDVMSNDMNIDWVSLLSIPTSHYPLITKLRQATWDAFIEGASAEEWVV